PAGVAAAGPPAPDTSGAVQEIGAVGTTAALPAHCGPGSRPETGMQGDVPAADRDNGRSAQATTATSPASVVSRATVPGSSRRATITAPIWAASFPAASPDP